MLRQNKARIVVTPARLRTRVRAPLTLQVSIRAMVCAIAAAILVVQPHIGPGHLHARPLLHDIPDVLAFVSDTSMRADIQALQDFGTRSAYNENRDEIARWILARFRQAGISEVALDSFPFQDGWQYNVIATIPGSDVPWTSIVVGAHHDSYSTDLTRAPGADDNASGVASVLETARAITRSGTSPGKTIRFMTFGAEELGLLGSADYAHKARERGDDIEAMLNVDMIGHRRADQQDRSVNVVWYYGYESLARLDSQVAAQYTTLQPRLTSSGRSGSDSYSFVREGYPAVFMIETDFNPFYHSPLDLLDTLDMTYAADITRARLALLLTLDGSRDSTRPPPDNVAGRYTLLPNYPNPFNGGTMIAFSIGSPTVLRLSVVSLLGQEVAVLAEGPFAPGVHRRWWRADGLASGVYVARLATGNGEMQSIRLALVR